MTSLRNLLFILSEIKNMNLLPAFATRLSVLFWLVTLLLATPVLSQETERVYDPADPVIGYNLISYQTDNPDELAEYFTAIDELVEVNADHVNLVVFRRVGSDGRIDFNSGPKLRTIIFASRYAKSNNLKVTLTPIFETETESAWRGDWNPYGTTRRNFVRHYTALLRQLANVAARTNADKLNLGSELVAFANDPRNRLYLNVMLALCGRLFDGELGYNANWDNFQNPSVKEIFWDHPRIDSISVSMYPYKRLATFEEADQSELDPEAFAELVKNRWSAIVTEDLLPYAASLKDGQGMPLSIGEFGAVAFNRCAVSPASFQPSDEVDAEEQEAVIMGLIHSVDQLGFEIPEITIWQWGIGDVSDRFGLNPFHESPQQSTALEILSFMQTAETPDEEEATNLPIVSEN
jgi:hypothetical protein